MRRTAGSCTAAAYIDGRGTFVITQAAEEGLRKSNGLRENRYSNFSLSSATASVTPSDIWPDELSYGGGSGGGSSGGDNPYYYHAHDGPLRNQSRRISKLITSRTELHSLNPNTPDPPKKKVAGGNGGSKDDDDDDQEQEVSSSGIKYWLQEIQTAKEHGGDYRERNLTATRAALGSFLTFSVLIFPHQHVLGAVWISNIFMHCNLAGSFGESLQSVQGYGISILLTTLLSFPVGLFLSVLDTNAAAILLPFVSFLLTFIIMSCPQLTSRNLMILVMYIVVATNVREHIEIWEPLGWVASYWIGLCIALLMNALPYLSNFAIQHTHQNLNRLEEDMTMLLLQCKAYSDHTASKPSIARAATASIELLQRRITKTVKTLKGKLSATTTELSWQCRSEAISDLSEWIAEAETLLAPLKSLRTALVQRVLGEEYAMHSTILDQQKAIIREEISEARDRMVDAMISSIAVCHAWADPSAYRTVLPDVQEELAISIEECRTALQRAMIRSSQMINAQNGTSIALFAHLTRRMTAFNALFELGEHILQYLQKHTWEAQQEKRFYDETISNNKRRRGGNFLLNVLCRIKAYLEKKWLWHNPDSFRLALKTAVGMSLASLFVSINYLWKISRPFGVWPGLTIASVNLASTGSSFHKASDRLFGTLLAAAFALLVSDLFPGNYDYVKIPAIAFFTFTTIYLRNSEHAYKYTYAATSIGSMLYGSIKNDFNIAGYIPKRIELIFTGVTIFSIVELLLFPRSSRKMVESLSFQYFLSMRDFLKQAAICTQRMEEYVSSADPDAFLRIGDSMDIFQLDKLAALHKALKAENSKLKKELDPGLQEPSLGLSLPLNSESFRGLAKEQGDCEVQALLLIKSLKALAKLYQEPNHPIRKLNWPRMHTKFLKDAVDRIDNACEWLKAAYPDGRLRAQRGNSVKAVTAAASFRGFEDVRIRTIKKWTDNYHQFTVLKESDMPDPASIMALGTSSTMSILELCRRLQKAGRHVEDVAHHFPASGPKNHLKFSQLDIR